MNYAEWEAQVPQQIRREPTWQFLGYRKALFLYELAWDDCDILSRDIRGKAITKQLIRSAGSICANMEEGQGRGYGKQRNWFFTISLGSARETKGWYWRAKRLLPKETLEERLALADEVIALLVNELHRQRSR